MFSENTRSMPAGQWGPHREFPDRLVPIEDTKPDGGAGGDLYIRWRRGFMRVCRRVVASIAPTQKSVPRSFSAEINTSMSSGKTPAISEPWRWAQSVIYSAGTVAMGALQTATRISLAGHPEILLWDVGRLFENAPVGRKKVSPKRQKMLFLEPIFKGNSPKSN